MNTDLRINETDICKWFEVFRPSRKVTEIRCVDRRGKSWSGYFRTPESVIEALKDNPDLLKGNVFQTFNAVHEGCYESRVQKDKFLLGAKSTSDDDIVVRDWVFIDIDPIRPSDTNATDEEEKYAINTARKIARFLRAEGFSDPVVIASANGAHLYYRCELKNTPENKTLCDNFIRVMRLLFNDEVIKIDSVIFNASRFAKLPGTMSGKGNPESTTHPQRWCRFLNVPKEIVINKRAIFEKIIKEHIPDASTSAPAYASGYNNRDKFDLQSFIDKYNIPVKNVVSTELGTRYILDHCLFNPEHKGKDAMIFQYTNGCLAYKCFHDSCSQYTWKDVRLLYEPDAYSRKDYADFSYKRKLRGQDKEPFVPQEETEENGKIWLGLDEIPTIDPDSIVSISTGITELDKKIYQGTILNQLTVLTGRPASGKSTLLSTILLHSIEENFPTAIFSGELPNHLLKSWIVKPAAGKNYVKQSSKRTEDSFYVPKTTETKILEWLKGKLFVHNSNYGNNWNQLREDIMAIIKQGVKNIILDNLMTIGLDYERDYEKSRAQISFIAELHEIVIHNPVHIWLVAHPRKQTNFLRYEDIAGASEIANYADNIFVVHRVNQDFENQAKAFFSKQMVEDLIDTGCTNVIEIAKNRIPGNHIGELVGMFYEPTSKRMENSRGDKFQFNWDNSTPAPEQDDFKDSTSDFDNQPEMWYNKDNDNGQDDNLPF